MTKIGTIETTAQLAWASSSQPMLACGTATGAFDASFNTSSRLDLYRLNKTKIKNIGSVNANGLILIHINILARFNRLAWANNPQNSILAGGLENGDLVLFNPDAIINALENQIILTQSLHSGPVKGLDFNPCQPNLLASGATDGEIFIWDINNPTTPYSPGSKSPRLEDITVCQWNRQVPHILATSSSNGYTIIWDLKGRKEVMQLAHPGGRKTITGIAWSNDNATQIVTASDDDTNPVVLMWDLRNARAPEKSLVGHSKGILSIAWCPKDSDLLVSCGKDNRTIVWNPTTGESIGDLHNSAKWSYDVQWCSRNPDLVGIASYDGKVTIHSLVGASVTTSVSNIPLLDKTQQQKSATNNDPFNTQQVFSEPEEVFFQLKQPPKWLRTPVSAVWGPGGRLVYFSYNRTANAQPQQQQIQHERSFINIKSHVSEIEFQARVDALYTVLRSGDVGQFQKYCHMLSSTTSDVFTAEDKQIWSLLKSLFEADKRNVVPYLGFDVKNPAGALAHVFEKLVVAEVPAKTKPLTVSTTMTADGNIDANGDATSTSIFDGINGTAIDDFPVDEKLLLKPKTSFQLYPRGANKSDSQIDTIITRSVVLGDFEAAVNVCLASDRFADAIIFAVSGGKELLEKTQLKYFERMNEKKTYMRVLESIHTGDLQDIVDNVVLDGTEETWKDIVALLCTHFSESENFIELLRQLGSRLEEGRLQPGKPKVERSKEKNQLPAVLCYILSGDLVKVMEIWGLQKGAPLVNGASLTSHTLMLQTLIEKVEIFRRAVHYSDAALVSPSTTNNFPLETLYERYQDYAVAVIQQGYVEFGGDILRLIPAEFTPKEAPQKLKILRDAVYNSPYSVKNEGSQAPPPFPFEVSDYYAKQQEQILQQQKLLQQQKTATSTPVQQHHQYQQQPQLQQQTNNAYGGGGYQPQPIQNQYGNNQGGGGGFYPAVGVHSTGNLPNMVGSGSAPYSTQQHIGSVSSHFPQTNLYNQSPYGSNSASISQQQPPPSFGGVGAGGYGAAASVPGSRVSGGGGGYRAASSYQQPYPVGGGSYYDGGVQQQPQQGYASQQGYSQGAMSPLPVMQSFQDEKKEVKSEPVGFPPGDRSHIPKAQMVIVESLEKVINKVTPIVHSSAKRQFLDGAKKVEILFDELNNSNVVEDVIKSLLELSKLAQNEDYAASNAILNNETFMKNHFNTTGKWLTGLKKVLHTANEVQKMEQIRLTSPVVAAAPPQQLSSMDSFAQNQQGGYRASVGGGAAMRPPMGGQMMGGQPPMGNQSMGGPPPMGNQMMGGQPPMGGPPMGGPPLGGPPMGGPPMGGQMMGGPPMGGQMMGGQTPSMVNQNMRGPPTGGQPPMGVQPPIGNQSMGRGPPMGGAPPMGMGGPPPPGSSPHQNNPQEIRPPPFGRNNNPQQQQPQPQYNSTQPPTNHVGQPNMGGGALPPPPPQMGGYPQQQQPPQQFGGPNPLQGRPNSAMGGGGGYQQPGSSYGGQQGGWNGGQQPQHNGYGG